MSREAIYSEAWKWILEAAESEIEDDTNEEGLPEDYYENLRAAVFNIFTVPHAFKEYL